MTIYDEDINLPRLKGEQIQTERPPRFLACPTICPSKTCSFEFVLPTAQPQRFFFKIKKRT